MQLAASGSLAHHVNRVPDDGNLGQTVLLKKPDTISEADVVGEYAWFQHLAGAGSYPDTLASYGTAIVDSNNTVFYHITRDNGTVEAGSATWSLNAAGKILNIEDNRFYIGQGGIMIDVWVDATGSQDRGITLLVKKSSNKSLADLAGEWLFQEYFTAQTDGELETMWGPLTAASDGSFLATWSFNDGTEDVMSGTLGVDPDGDVVVSFGGQLFNGAVNVDGDVFFFLEAGQFGDCGIGIAIRKPCTGTLTIGGAVFTDLANPLSSGLADVDVTVSGSGGTFQATSAGPQGLWQVENIPEGTYTVTPTRSGYSFEHVDEGVPDRQASITIDVNEVNQGTYQSIQFLAEQVQNASLHDWNADGIISIIGDVPPFVDCVYFGSCPSGVDTIAVGDCNSDGILSIVGDVPCFVDCVYFGDCPQ
jgi:hypothetical protein